MGTDYQTFRASVNMSKAFRQFQKADNALSDGNSDSAVNHLADGLDYFQKSMDHLGKAADDNLNDAYNQIDKGNQELQKSIDAYSDGNDDRASNHYSKALDCYDEALDLLI